MKIDFKENKISFVMFLIGCALLLIASNTKYLYAFTTSRLQGDGTYRWVQGDNEWYVSFPFGTYKYDEFFTLTVVFITISIYLFIYKDDELIKRWVNLLLNKINFQKEKLLKLVSSGVKSLKRPRNIDNKNEIITNEIGINKTNSKLSTFILVYIILVLVISFFNNDKFVFFIFLPFYFFMDFKPKSYKDIYKKSFLNPLYFVLLFAIFRSYAYYNLVQNISANLVFYAISAVIIYFILKDKYLNNRIFSFKHPIFWISLLFLLKSIGEYYLSVYLQNIISTIDPKLLL